MAKEVFMPKLSSTMEVGTLLQWFVEEGDSVEVGDPIFEIMTDKINIEVESYEAGIFLKKYYEVDDEIPVNAVIGYIGEENETVPDEPPQGSNEDENVAQEVAEKEEKINQIEETETSTNIGNVRATPAARKIARDNDVVLAAIAGSGPKGRIHAQDVQDSLTGNDTLITPLAAKIAQDKGLDVSQIKGSGSRGKIEKADVLRYAETLTVETQTEEEPERIKMTGLRKAVADAMLKNTQSIPHVTLTSEVDMTKAIDMRKSLLPMVEEQTGYRLSFTEIIMKTTASVLSRHTNVNASLIDNEIILNKSVHIGLAVAVENGLIVPTIRHADKKGLAELTETSKTLGLKARENKLTPAEMSGSTFTISNLGMYAIDAFTPIINAPETAILGVGQITKKAVVVNDAVEIRPMMVLSLSFDHRVIDGAPAAAFLTELKGHLENPYGLLV